MGHPLEMITQAALAAAVNVVVLGLGPGARARMIDMLLFADVSQPALEAEGNAGGARQSASP